MNFKDYVKKQNLERESEQRKASRQNVQDNQNTYTKQTKEEQVEKLVNDYAGKNENELISELLREVAKGKANGTLSNNDIDNFYQQAFPMLTVEQRQRLNEIIKLIRD